MNEGEQLIRAVWGRWNDGDRDPEAPEIDPEIEIGSALVKRDFHGPEGLREWIAEIEEQFDSWRLEIEDVRELRPDAFVVRGAILARGRHSGVDLDQPASWRVLIRDGRIRRIDNFIGANAWTEVERGTG
jgi:ketosteroid isomerase-like protein